MSVIIQLILDSGKCSVDMFDAIGAICSSESPNVLEVMYNCSPCANNRFRFYLLSLLLCVLIFSWNGFCKNIAVKTTIVLMVSWYLTVGYYDEKPKSGELI